MEPCGRLLLSFPVYGMSILPDGSVAVTGGGGRMKSGIPNACEIHSFNESTRTFSKTGSISLPDAPTALATHKDVLVTIVGTGCKNFLYKNQKLSEESDYEHDIKVSSSEEQSAIAFSSDGTRLILASDEGPVRVLRYPECEELANVKMHTEGVNDIDVSSDGLTVASSARDKCTYLWHTDTGAAIQNLKPVFKDQFKTCIRAVRFSPVDPDQLFAVESNSRKGGTWISSWRKSGNRKSSWQNVAHFHALAEAVSTFAVSSDGRLIAVSSVEGHVALLSWNGSSFNRIWNTETRTAWFQPAKASHALPVTALRFSHSNEYLLTASADWTVAVWPAYKPWNFKPLRRWMKRMTWLFVLLLAYILAEHKLPPHVQQRRVDVMPPSLNPYISDFQRTARPVLTKGAEEVRAAAVKNILPHLEPHIEKFERDAMPVLRQRAHEARAVVFDDILPRLQRHLSKLQRRVQFAARQGVRKARSMRKQRMKPVDQVRDATFTHFIKKEMPFSNDLSHSPLPMDDLKRGIEKPEHKPKEMSSAPQQEEETPMSLKTQYENTKMEEKWENEVPSDVLDPSNKISDVGSLENIEGSDSITELQTSKSKRGQMQEENHDRTAVSETNQRPEKPVLAEPVASSEGDVHAQENVSEESNSSKGDSEHVGDFAISSPALSGENNDSTTKDGVDRQKDDRTEKVAVAEGAGADTQESSTEDQNFPDNGSEHAVGTEKSVQGHLSAENSAMKADVQPQKTQMIEQQASVTGSPILESVTEDQNIYDQDSERVLESRKSEPSVASKGENDETVVAAKGDEKWTDESVTPSASSSTLHASKSAKQGSQEETSDKSANTIVSEDITQREHVHEEDRSDHAKSALGHSVEAQGDVAEGISHSETSTEEDSGGASADQISAIDSPGEYCQPRRPWEQPAAKFIS